MSNSIGILLDVETTGLSPYEDEIVEIALVKFSFDKSTGEVLDILDRYTALREPKSTSAKSNYGSAYKIHGISFSKVKGKEFDHQRIYDLFGNVEYAFAHNASFDRSFVCCMYPELNEVKWHCSMKHIDWDGYGLPDKKLLTILKKHKLSKSQSHRALDDVSLTLELLKCLSPAGATYLKEMIMNRPMRKYSQQYMSAYQKGQGTGEVIELEMSISTPSKRVYSPFISLFFSKASVYIFVTISVLFSLLFLLVNVFVGIFISAFFSFMIFAMLNHRKKMLLEKEQFRDQGISA
jgi:DNA polymerase-3 subunit epsilon